MPRIKESTTGEAMPTLTTSHQSSDAADRAVTRLARTNPAAAAELEFELAAIDTAYEMPLPYADGDSCLYLMRFIREFV